MLIIFVTWKTEITQRKQNILIFECGTVGHTYWINVRVTTTFFIKLTNVCLTGLLIYLHVLYLCNLPVTHLSNSTYVPWPSRVLRTPLRNSYVGSYTAHAPATHLPAPTYPHIRPRAPSQIPFIFSAIFSIPSQLRTDFLQEILLIHIFFLMESGNIKTFPWALIIFTIWRLVRNKATPAPLHARCFNAIFFKEQWHTYISFKFSLHAIQNSKFKCKFLTPGRNLFTLRQLIHLLM